MYERQINQSLQVLATALEGRFVLNCDKEPVRRCGKLGSEKFVSCHGCMENQGGRLEHFL